MTIADVPPVAAAEAVGPRPLELPELTTARGVAAAMVVLYHLDGYSGGLIGTVFPTDVLGRLAVDFFFVLSGFVLAHVYGAAWAEGRFGYRDFLVKRLARIWPLHLACLLGVAAIVGAGSMVGMAPPWKPTLSSFLEHLTLLNAVGLATENAWNQPSWSVGAEWTAYLAFPLYMWMASALRWPLAKLAAAMLALAAVWTALQAIAGADLFALTNAGALRIAPSFFAGVVLRQVMASGAGSDTSAAQVNRLVLETLAVMALVAWAGAPAPLLWLGVLGLVYLLALKGRRAGPGAFRSRPFTFAGEISYALYLVHAPVLMLTFGLGAKALGLTSATGLLALGAVGATLSIAAATVAHYVVERPAQRLIVGAALGRTENAPA